MAFNDIKITNKGNRNKMAPSAALFGGLKTGLAQIPMASAAFPEAGKRKSAKRQNYGKPSLQTGLVPLLYRFKLRTVGVVAFGIRVPILRRWLLEALRQL
jgi:hypothetical protein